MSPTATLSAPSAPGDLDLVIDLDAQVKRIGVTGLNRSYSRAERRAMTAAVLPLGFAPNLLG